MRRKTTRNDFETVYEIYMDDTVNPYQNFEHMSRAAFRPIFRAMMAGGGFQVYELEGEVIAALVVRRFEHRLRHLAYLGALGIKREFQGRGYGTKILRELIHDLRAGGATRIELLVEADNARAIAFYHKLGFEREGTHRNYLNRAADPGYTDAHLMGLLLE